jgi:Carboxypeptidase regulatory-like domain
MVRKRNETLLRLGTICLLGLALAGVAGCGKPKGVVTGKVTLKDGKPVSPGTIVTFWVGDNQAIPGVTNAEGAYSVPNAPVGDAKVTVTAPTPMPAVPVPGGKGEAAPPKVIPIPAKYKDKSATPLKFKVEPGTHEFNITIEP